MIKFWNTTISVPESLKKILTIRLWDLTVNSPAKIATNVTKTTDSALLPEGTSHETNQQSVSGESQAGPSRQPTDIINANKGKEKANQAITETGKDAFSSLRPPAHLRRTKSDGLLANPNERYIEKLNQDLSKSNKSNSKQKDFIEELTKRLLGSYNLIEKTANFIGELNKNSSQSDKFNSEEAKDFLIEVIKKTRYEDIINKKTTATTEGNENKGKEEANQALVENEKGASSSTELPRTSSGNALSVTELRRTSSSNALSVKDSSFSTELRRTKSYSSYSPSTLEPGPRQSFAERVATTASANKQTRLF